MLEIDVTNPDLDWNDYTYEQLINARLIAPGTENDTDDRTLLEADLQMVRDAEEELRRFLTPVERNRREAVQRERAARSISAAREALKSMGSIRANIDVLQGKKFAPKIAIPKIDFKVTPSTKIAAKYTPDMSNVVKALTKQVSEQFNIPLNAKGELASEDDEDAEKVEPVDTEPDEASPSEQTPQSISAEPVVELTDKERKELREAQAIAQSPELRVLVNQISTVTGSLASSKEADDLRARTNAKFTWASIIIAGLSLILAITTACITLLRPTPTVEFPSDPMPVQIVEQQTD